MKKIANKLTKSALLVFVCAALFSFSRPFGGDSFQVYMNGKLILDRAVYKNTEIQNLELVQASSTDKVEIYYNHCGQTGTSRSITAKDDQHRVLKTWHFSDGKGTHMQLPLQMLKDLQTTNKPGSISLYYSSKEHEAAQELVSVNIANKSMAVR